MQGIITAIIIAAAFVYTLFSIYRWNKRKGCGCSDKKSGECDLCDGCSECSKRDRKKGRRIRSRSYQVDFIRSVFIILQLFTSEPNYK